MKVFKQLKFQITSEWKFNFCSRIFYLFYESPTILIGWAENTLLWLAENISILLRRWNSMKYDVKGYNKNAVRGPGKGVVLRSDDIGLNALLLSQLSNVIKPGCFDKHGNSVTTFTSFLTHATSKNGLGIFKMWSVIFVSLKLVRMCKFIFYN